MSDGAGGAEASGARRDGLMEGLAWEDMLEHMRRRLIAAAVDVEERLFCHAERAAFEKCMGPLLGDAAVAHDAVVARCGSQLKALEACSAIDTPERAKAVQAFVASAKHVAETDERCAASRAFLAEVLAKRAEYEATGRDPAMGARFFEWGGPDSAVAAAQTRLAACGAALHAPAYSREA